MSFRAGSPVWLRQVLEGRIPESALHSLPVHPLQLYFLLLAFAVGLFLLWLLPRRQYEGQVLLAYLALHETGKALLESLRVPYLPALQTTSLVLGLGALLALFAIPGWRRRALPDSDPA